MDDDFKFILGLFLINVGAGVAPLLIDRMFDDTSTPDEVCEHVL